MKELPSERDLHAENCPHRRDDNLGCDCGVIPTVASAPAAPGEDGRHENALRKLIRNNHLARQANEIYFKRVNENWQNAQNWIAGTPCPTSGDPLIPALAFIEAAEDEASR